MFGQDHVDVNDRQNISVTVDGKTVNIFLETRVRLVLCNIALWTFSPWTGACRNTHLTLFSCPDQSVSYEDEDTEDDSLRELVEQAVQRLFDALNPITSLMPSLKWCHFWSDTLKL